MDLIHWEQDHGSDRVDDYNFFERPLAGPTLFHFKTRRMDVAPHAGAFSLKFTLNGRETYAFDRRRVCLIPGEMLLVDRGRTYGSEISEQTESLSLFLPNAWVQETAASMQQNETAFLNEPQATRSTSLPVVPSRLSNQGQATLRALAESAQIGGAANAEEQSLALLAEALSQIPLLHRQQALLTEHRADTRDEILTRLRRAHDRIVDEHGLGLDLHRLGQTACLSRFHFLRLFKQVYGQTPLRFAASIRMRRAMGLAASGDLPSALRAGGFGSRSAFHRARRRKGLGQA